MNERKRIPPADAQQPAQKTLREWLEEDLPTKPSRPPVDGDFVRPRNPNDPFRRFRT